MTLRVLVLLTPASGRVLGSRGNQSTVSYWATMRRACLESRRNGDCTARLLTHAGASGRHKRQHATLSPHGFPKPSSSSPSALAPPPTRGGRAQFAAMLRVIASGPDIANARSSALIRQSAMTSGVRARRVSLDGPLDRSIDSRCGQHTADDGRRGRVEAGGY